MIEILLLLKEYCLAREAFLFFGQLDFPDKAVDEPAFKEAGGVGGGVLFIHPLA